MRQRKGALHVLWRIRIDFMEFPQIILPLKCDVQVTVLKSEFIISVTLDDAIPLPLRVNFTNLDDTMIQILLLRLCWQLTSCAILKILEYYSKILPRRNKYRAKTPKAAQRVTRPHVIYWRLLVLPPELSIFSPEQEKILQSYAQMRAFRCSS